MDHQSSTSAEEDLAPWVERQTLRVLGSFLPRSVRRRQIHEWQDQLNCTRATDGDLQRELMQVIRSTPSIAWTTLPSLLRASLPPLAVAMMSALVLWPGRTPPPDDQKLHVLAATASAYTPQIATLVRNNGSPDQIDNLVSTISDRTNARVTLLSVGDGTEGLQLATFSDSSTQSDNAALLDDTALLDVKVAHEAARTGRVALSADSSREGKLGQVAMPIRDQGTVSRVAVFSAPMAEIHGNVALQTARGLTPQIAMLVRNNGSPDQIDNLVSTISDRTNARVTLLAVRDRSNALQLAIVSDSDTDTRITNLDLKDAEFVARTGRIAVGLDSSQPELSQIALPIRDDGAISHVVVFKGQE